MAMKSFTQNRVEVELEIFAVMVLPLLSFYYPYYTTTLLNYLT